MVINGIWCPLVHRMHQGAFCLESFYEVYEGTQQIGKVQVLRQGLYYRLICRCNVQSDQIYRLYLHNAGAREKLGVLIPDGDGMFLDKKIPVKRIGEGEFRFSVSTDQSAAVGTFIPIQPEEPFAYIDRLKTAFLKTENGKVGIVTEEKPETV